MTDENKIPEEQPEKPIESKIDPELAKVIEHNKILTAELKKLQETNAAFLKADEDRKLAEMTETERLKAEREAAIKAAEMAKAEAMQIKKDAEIDKSLFVAGVKDADLLKLKIISEGIQDIPAFLEAEKKTRPYLFGEPGRATTGFIPAPTQAHTAQAPNVQIKQLTSNSRADAEAFQKLLREKYKI